ncbi:MAG: 4Fe-4S binding protein [Candidatus Bathyarchaeota archaeon]|nr:4Fe-4S binding protein [Candidatus Bathyarchaeota archaeon]MDH5788775.1 4Fe-4S binding protein [Candidatus Bathyarchaeota archaeon]
MNSENLKKKVLEWGACIVGFADLEGVLPKRVEPLKIGVSIIVRLSDVIIDEIRNGPTPTYAHHYRTVNQLLDSMAIKSSNLIQSWGYKALPIPASQKVNDKKLEGLISHKMVATRAGLGWIGKNALLITPQYGPRVRLVSVLTDAPLRTSQPISESKCGKCLLCVKVCPVRALKGRNWTSNVQRDNLIDVNLCHTVTKHNKKILGEAICGVCVSVCPVGRA